MFFFSLFLVAIFFRLFYDIGMIEIRIKSNSVKEIHEIVAFLRSNPFNGYIFHNLSKVYVMKNGQYKFFADCLKYEDFKSLETLNLSAETQLMNKKRGRKLKMRETL